MRTSTEIQHEYDKLKIAGQIEKSDDKAYQAAIHRAKLEEQAKEQREHEAKVDEILNPTIG